MEPRKPKHIILDSGAFSVWTKGISIDINQYIDFCKQHPLISYYVNLDVIPGIPNKHKTVNKKTTEEAAQKSWENYQRMLEYFPIEKVIPVFHQNEDFKWLNKYIEFGTPYIEFHRQMTALLHKKLDGLNRYKNIQIFVMKKEIQK